MNKIQTHRGPDGEGIWTHTAGHVGFAHRRLSIIDLSTGDQPMKDSGGNWVVFNGEIYNYLELRKEIGEDLFKTHSDTEVILYAYRKWCTDCVNHFRGMFSFGLWDESKQMLFFACDRFGIMPFYYATVGDVLYFASKAKALLPFLPEIDIDVNGLKDYLVFQFCLAGKTLFSGIREFLPAHRMIVKNGSITVERYWEVYYNIDYDHTAKYFTEKLRAMLDESVAYHVRSDVHIGAYISGGVDSTSVAALGSKEPHKDTLLGFIGKFAAHGENYDETRYALDAAKQHGIPLHEIDITSKDFVSSIRKIIYHLDYPVAGPGSFPQYMVSSLAAKHRKVVLGGQGGDEIFGGYVRYLIAYFEQCIKRAIDGTLRGGNFVVTYESIIPNLVALKQYTPMLKDFFSDDLFDPIDSRYYRLVNRAPTLKNEIRWDELGEYHPFETFQSIFHGPNVAKEAYFDSMTHFDFKTLLPALLQVEDRMSMAHGLESRVPLLDHLIVEFTATIPADVKFKNGTLKMLYLNAVEDVLPGSIRSRKNKMVFPVPLTEWFAGDLKDFVGDIFTQQRARQRQFFNSDEIVCGLSHESKFGRKVWGLFSLELWHEEFLDKANEYKKMAQ